jgi:nitrile hydratase subunit alpha
MAAHDDHDHDEHDQAHSHDHGHSHWHDHHKSWQAVRTEAMEALLSELGVVDSNRVDEIVSYYEEGIGPKSGVRVVAKAWTDPAFKARLLANGLEACAELGLAGPETEYLHVVENSQSVHNVIVCTPCSCYPWTILGLPPAWYKSSAYRSRLVREPRRVLSELGLALDDNVKIQVWDSVSEIRYLVLPERPAGTEAMTEEELAAIVTRNSMIGVSRL